MDVQPPIDMIISIVRFKQSTFWVIDEDSILSNTNYKVAYNATANSERSGMCPGMPHIYIPETSGKMTIRGFHGMGLDSDIISELKEAIEMIIYCIIQERAQTTLIASLTNVSHSFTTTAPQAVDKKNLFSTCSSRNVGNVNLGTSKYEMDTDSDSFYSTDQDQQTFHSSIVSSTLNVNANYAPVLSQNYRATSHVRS